MKITDTIKWHSHATRWSLKTALLFGALLTLFVGVAMAVHVYASDDERPKGSRVITLYDRGLERSFVTTASTIHGALQEAGIEIDERDRVEPGLDEALVADEYAINIYRARPLLVVDGSLRHVIMTAAQVPEQIAEDAKLTLYDEDTTVLEQSDNLLVDGAAERLVVDRAVPFTLTLYGKTFTARTQAETVEGILKEKNITLSDNDRMSMKAEDSVTRGMKLRIWREGRQTITKDEKVNFEVEQIQDANRPVGYRSIKTPGVKGVRTVTYQVIIRDGKEVKRKEIASVTKKKPKKQVEIVGVKPSFSGDFAAALAKLRQCESTNNYQINTGNGYYGAYQYDIETWGGYGGYPNAAAAPPAVQDQKVRETYEARGWSPWPRCGASLPDTYR